MATDTQLNAWIEQYKTRISNLQPVEIQGKVIQVNGILVESHLPFARIGDLCTIHGSDNKSILAEIVGFNANTVLLSALGALEGIAAGARITPHYQEHRILSDDGLLGAVLDGFGRLLQGPKAAFTLEDHAHAFPVISEALSPTQRPRICQPLPTGVRAIDGLLTIGEGQRIGVFAGAGCGKTTLLAELARNMPSDVIVFGLIGERGENLREFLDHELDDEPAPVRF
ncbi:hypothetical protein P4S72_10705 [Vibrio sp. PP-XX7]